MTKTLIDTDIVTTRRTALRSFALKTGLGAAAVAAGVAIAASPASAADRHNQTDTDTGARSDAPSQTDND